MHAETLAVYDRHVPHLHNAGEELRARLVTWLAADASLQVHSVTLRVKDRTSLAAKLTRPDRTYAELWDVTDTVGIRIITYFADGVERVAQLVEQNLAVDFQHTVDKRREREDGTFGYRSLHYVCKLAGAGLPAGARVEIQVRTMLEHAWAAIEHTVGYKAQESIPLAARRRLSRLAGLLELADQEFVAIRAELDEYASNLPDRILAADTEVPLDRMSLGLLLDQPDVRAADAAIAAELGKPVGTDVFYPEYLVRMLHTSGVETVAAARSALDKHRPTLLAMVGPYFRFATAAWRLNPTTLLRGYSLFFLAHALVLAAPTLGVTKVARLTALYQATDYPDDPREAQRVAGALVEAISPRDSSPT